MTIAPYLPQRQTIPSSWLGSNVSDLIGSYYWTANGRINFGGTLVLGTDASSANVLLTNGIFLTPPVPFQCAPPGIEFCTLMASDLAGSKFFMPVLISGPTVQIQSGPGISPPYVANDRCLAALSGLTWPLI